MQNSISGLATPTPLQTPTAIRGPTQAQNHWIDLHEALTALALERASLDGREAPALLLARRANVHIQLGFGSFHEYVERLFGYSFRTTEDKLRVAEALETLPLSAQALFTGETTWCALRELARVATPETEAEWLTAARDRTVREVEQLVSGRLRGDRPSDEPRSGALRHVLRFEVTAETLATFREAMKHLCQASGSRLDDDASLLLMARHILGGSHPDGAASYQITISACPQCGKTRQQAAGDRVEIDSTAFDMACCDARHVKPIERSPMAHASSLVDPSEATHVGDTPPHSKPARLVTRATQTIPPALRRRVVDRDQGRCVVPGCRHAMFLDVHHLQPRAEAGPHTLDNLVVLCAAHHRASHRGQLLIRGSASTGLHFEHADGTTYGGTASAAAVAVSEQVFRGLRNLGFREKDARSALERVRAKQASAETDAAQLIRAALAELVKPAWRIADQERPVDEAQALTPLAEGVDRER